MCDLVSYGERCNVADLKANADKWQLRDQPIGYCLAQMVEPHCKLQFSRYILIAVIICNVCKAAAMFGTLSLQHEPTLVTAGDAISSWLEHSDAATKDRCLMSARDTAQRGISIGNSGCSTEGNTSGAPVAYHRPKADRWYHAVNRRRWIFVMTLCSLTIIIAGLLLNIAYSSLISDTESTIQSTGFGAIKPGAMLDIGLPSTGTRGLMANVLLANLPQLIFSCLYLLYNGLFTSMCLAHEYSSYSVCRKALRVTSPRGVQRSTHWLHLPYTYSVPLLAASSLLHWSISQSIFFVGIDVYGNSEEADSTVGLGYSIQPIILDIILGSCMLLVVMSMAFRKLPGGIPLANSNSMAISAACHRPEHDTDAAFKSVMWGEIAATADSDVGHCTFTSIEVVAPVEGKMYAGMRRLK